MENELWTLKELAQFLRLSVGAVRTMMWRDEIPAAAFVRIGRRVRVRRAAIEKWLRDQAA